MIEQTIIELIKEKIYEEKEITLESSLDGDLNLDILDMVELLLEIEEHFCICFNDEESDVIREELLSVRDLVQFVENKIDKRSNNA